MIFRHELPLEPAIADLLPPVAERWGFRTGRHGTHTSRTIMLNELTQLLDAVPASAPKSQYSEAIVEGNCLGKLTAATRRASSQRLRELYGLDERLILFRALRHLWAGDEAARPTLALLLALARDPLLRASARAVLATPIGQEFSRQPMKDDLAATVEGRLNPATLDAVVRNASASWTQSGHLIGRSRKTRQRVRATPATATYALLIDSAVGAKAHTLYDSPWVVVTDARIDEFLQLVMDANMLNLLEFKRAGKMTALSFPALVTNKERELIHSESHR